jgi:hypothetical protein
MGSGRNLMKKGMLLRRQSLKRVKRSRREKGIGGIRYKVYKGNRVYKVIPFTDFRLPLTDDR